MSSIRYLTKSRFKLALECPTKLYYTKKEDEYFNKKGEDPFLKSLAEGGYQVGELAKRYYPNGYDITESGYEIPLQRTSKLLEKEEVVIFEAAIAFNNLFIRIDILEKKGNKFRLIEVKSKSTKGTDDSIFLNNKKSLSNSWKPYLYDIAFQKYVLQKAFPDAIIDSYLMLADKNSKASVTGLNQKFQLITDQSGNTNVNLIGDTSLKMLGNKVLIEIKVNKIVDSILGSMNNGIGEDQSFEDSIDLFATAYKNDSKLNVPIASKCAACEFHSDNNEYKSGFIECWKSQTKLSETDLRKPLIFDLWNNRKKDLLIEKGIFLLKDIKKEDLGIIKHGKDGILSSTERQWMQIEKEINNDKSVYIDKPGLIVAFQTHQYPLHFIDFETSMVAIPFYKEGSPYEQIAFQYSHHILEKDGTIIHASQFIHIERGTFPNFEFLRALKKDLENDEGSIFCYSAHENTVLCQIKDQLLESNTIDENDKIELIDFIDSITISKKHVGKRSMVDMLKLVKKFYYDPQTKGSNSIKEVLPAVINNSKYIQLKYKEPIYGKNCEIVSLNFDTPKIWIQRDKDNKIISPYKLLGLPYSKTEEDVSFNNNGDITGGGDAMAAFAKIQFAKIIDNERIEILEALLKYCELDTLAMVMIYEYWLHEESNR